MKIRARRPKHRSHFEDNFAQLLDRAQISYSYEAIRVPYVITHHYTPDWQITSDIACETKGVFHAKDRTKALAVRAQNPELQIIFCFQDPNKRLTKSSKTTYAQWCVKHNFLWCEANERSVRTAINTALKIRWNRTGKDKN